MFELEERFNQDPIENQDAKLQIYDLMIIKFILEESNNKEFANWAGNIDGEYANGDIPPLKTVMEGDAFLELVCEHIAKINPNLEPDTIYEYAQRAIASMFNNKRPAIQNVKRLKRIIK